MLTGPIGSMGTFILDLGPVSFHTQYLVGILQTFKNTLPHCLLILHIVRVGVMKLHRNEVAQ